MQKKLSFLFFILIWLQGYVMAVSVETLQVKDVKIPVIYEKSTLLPMFSAKIIFRNAGSLEEDKTGLANLVGEILNEGSKKRGNVKFANSLESRAISLDINAGRETLGISLNALKEEQNYAFELLGELLGDPNFTENALKKVKLRVNNELLDNANDFDYQATIGLNALLFPNTPYAKPHLGTQKSLQGITLKDIQGFYKDKLSLKRAIIVLGGDVDYKSAEKSLQKILSNFAIGEEVKPYFFEASNKEKTKRSKKPTQQAYIYFGAPLVVKDLQSEAAKIRVASFVLGGSGFGSRMMEEIRVKRGLAYSAYMRLSATPSLSYATGFLQTALKNEEDAIKVVHEVVGEFLKNGITQKELDDAKQYLLGSEPLRNETLSQRLSNTFNNYYQNLPLDFDKQLLKDIQNLTLKDVNDYIKAHPEIAQLSFSIVSDH